MVIVDNNPTLEFMGEITEVRIQKLKQQAFFLILS